MNDRWKRQNQKQKKNIPTFSKMIQQQIKAKSQRIRFYEKGKKIFFFH